jgi:molecular chaperone DnaK (HSP70)
MTRWALDLGTTNTGLARWDAAAHRPRLLELPDVCRRPQGADDLEAPRLVPSATQILPERGFLDRLGGHPFLLKRALIGEHALIGRPALDANDGALQPGFAPRFKGALARAPLRHLCRLGDRSFTARDVGQHFLRQLLVEVKTLTGERIRELVVTAPVDSYETYRAEVAGICHRLGVTALRFIDEPVAAAIGYGVGLEARKRVLVVDFGGGTLDLALVDISARGIEQGSCEVVAKAGRAIGGDLVDTWLLADFASSLGYRLDEHGPGDQAFWYRLMLLEARRVKEAVFFRPSETFAVTPPEDLALFEQRLRGKASALRFDRERLVALLEQRGLYEELRGCVDEVLVQARARGIGPDDIDDVLMVGGSTLLPDVYSAFEARFGRDRVRAWQPFEAVAYGASAYGAGAFQQSDFIVHDYAFVTHDPKTHEPQHTVIIPRGTRVPTPRDVWKRRLVPTCSLGEPERFFKLVVAEVGKPEAAERAFGFDGQGQLHKLGGEGGTQALVVPLNEANPTLGTLEPPHAPSDKAARLEIAFFVNEDRWLCATVEDLRTKKTLMRDEPVVRLL